MWVPSIAPKTCGNEQLQNYLNNWTVLAVLQFVFGNFINHEANLTNSFTKSGVILIIVDLPMPNTLLTVLYEFPVTSHQIPIVTRFPTLMASLKVVECFWIFSRSKPTTNPEVSGDMLYSFTHKSWKNRSYLLYHILSNHDWSYSIIQFLRLVGSIYKFIK